MLADAPECIDDREETVFVVRDGEIVEGVTGGWGTWRFEPPLRFEPGHGFVDGEYLNVPVPMTQDELRRQHDWAMARSDRKSFRPAVR
jgi:hypothetical protein